MTLEKMKEIMDRNGVPGNARLMSNSGWELGATDMNEYFGIQKRM